MEYDPSSNEYSDKIADVYKRIRFSLRPRGNHVAGEAIDHSCHVQVWVDDNDKVMVNLSPTAGETGIPLRPIAGDDYAEVWVSEAQIQLQRAGAKVSYVDPADGEPKEAPLTYSYCDVLPELIRTTRNQVDS